RRWWQRARALGVHRQTSSIHDSSGEHAMISRRSMSTALGLGAGSLFLPSLRRGRGRAHADPAAPPQRLIIVTTGHGCVHENWNMRPEGLTGPDVADWDFPLTTQ